MDIQVPLNKLHFGHEVGDGINARVAGRLEGIEALAANIFARGQIENLVVYHMFDGDYGVSNGNRRLAALHQIHGADNSVLINCTVREVDETQAFEDSLTTAVTARQLHPVDQYEAFARLEGRGKTNEEIARQYGMTEKEVRQALALGRLSPKIRDAWRNGEIKREVAQAFTLALDHATQDKAYAKLAKAGKLWESYVKDELGAANIDVAELLDFVGADRYRESGGSVVEDLFGRGHVVSDPALLKAMASDKLKATCEHLRSSGWAWAELLSDLPKGARWWTRTAPKSLAYEGEEEAQVASLRAAIQKYEDAVASDDGVSDDDYEVNEQRLTELAVLEQEIGLRSYSQRQKEKFGCIVDLEDGRLVVLFGVTRPVEAQSAASTASAGSEAKSGEIASPPEPAISQALSHRLTVQLTKAAGTALLQDPDLALSVLLAGFSCYGGAGLKVNVSGLEAHSLDLLGTKELPQALSAVMKLDTTARMALLAEVAAAALDFQNMPLDGDKRSGPSAICGALDAKALNSALRGAFDAKDYFGGVNKALCLAAIEEACGPDLARQQAKNPKGDIAAFAIANVPATGWLPPQLRAKGYDGPPVAKPALVVDKKPTNKGAAAAKKPAAKKASAKKTAKPKAAKKAAVKKTANKRKA